MTMALRRRPFDFARDKWDCVSEHSQGSCATMVTRAKGVTDTPGHGGLLEGNAGGRWGTDRPRKLILG
jgi:hypothetical protein